MTENFKLKQAAESVMKILISLNTLIEIAELPIEVEVKIIKGHKNLNTVWKDVGIITLNR